MRTTNTDQAHRPARRTTGAALALAALVAGGCAWHEPARVEEDFGESVRQMVQAQIHDPQTAARPAVNGPELLDGTTADISIEGYRQSASEARTIRTQRPDNPVPVTGIAAEAETDR